MPVINSSKPSPKPIPKRNPKKLGGYIQPDSPDTYIKPKDRPRLRHYGHQAIVDPEGDADYIKWAADKGVITRVDTRSLQAAANPAVRRVARAYENTAGIMTAVTDTKKSGIEGYRYVKANEEDLDDIDVIRLLKQYRPKPQTGDKTKLIEEKDDLIEELGKAAVKTEKPLDTAEVIDRLKDVIPGLEQFDRMTYDAQLAILAKLKEHAYYLSILYFMRDLSGSDYKADTSWLAIPTNDLKNIVTGKTSNQYNNLPFYDISYAAVNNFVYSVHLGEIAITGEFDINYYTDNWTIEQKYFMMYSVLETLEQYKNAYGSMCPLDFNISVITPSIPHWDSESWSEVRAVANFLTAGAWQQYWLEQADPEAAARAEGLAAWRGSSGDLTVGLFVFGTTLAYGVYQKYFYSPANDNSATPNNLNPKGEGDSKQLGKNLTDDGRPKPSQDAQAHHIVPHGHPLAERARNILARFGIQYDEAINGVWVSPSDNKMFNQSKYIEKVTQLLERASTPAEAEQILTQIRIEIENGTFYP